MSRNVAFPFLTLPDRAVETGDWMIGNAGEPLFPCESMLDFWDYDRDLDVGLGLVIDLPAVSEALDLGHSELNLLALLKIGTGRGTQPRAIPHTVSVPVDRSAERTWLAATLDSSRLSSRLWLEASLVLAAEPARAGRLSPRQPGSRLWSSSFNILLEDGGDARLPMETVSFSKVFAGKSHEDALWYLDWRQHAWDLDFGGNIRLYLNRDRETFMQEVLAGEPFHLHMIMSDVMNQLVSAYIRSDVSEFPHDHPDGSLAKQAWDWLSLAFPGVSVDAIRTLLQDKPGEFHAALASAAEIGSRT